MNQEKERQHADVLVSKALACARTMEDFGQADVDRLVEAVYRTAFNARINLAEAAVAETGIGNKRDKSLKNAFASLIVYRDIRDIKSVGVIREDAARGIVEVAQPVGPVLCLTPVTNPTSTVINKALICLKTRNPVIFSPHRAARKCSRKAAEILYEAARAAGAPEGCIQWSTKTHWAYTESLMQHPGIALILATTAFHFVKQAYRSGNPVLGSGEGNVPVFVDRSADLEFAARSIVESKTFDNGTVCCSEQALVVTREVDGEMREMLQKHGGYFCKFEEKEKLGTVVFDTSREIMRSDVVGQTALFIAQKAGLSVPKETRLLLAPLEAIGGEEPLSHEILAPVMAYYVAKDFEAAKALIKAINQHHGLGHTLSLYTRDTGQAKALTCLIKAGRVLVNTPSTLGGLGGTLNRLHPSLTLSCGGGGGNYTSDNITVHHLLNINRLAYPSTDPVWGKVPDAAWLDPGFDAERLEDLSSGD